MDGVNRSGHHKDERVQLFNEKTQEKSLCVDLECRKKGQRDFRETGKNGVRNQLIDNNMNDKDKTLEEKIEALLKGREEKDRLKHYLEMYKAIDGYIKESEKKPCFLKELFKRETETNPFLEKNFNLNFCRNYINLKLKVSVDDVINALHFYYKSKIAEYIENKTELETN